MRVGLYGGSFDPIHYGHVVPVRAAQQELELDVVIYLPTASPPHKPGRKLAPVYARFTMVELALLPYPDLITSFFEMRSMETTYTVDTVEHFQRALPGEELFFLLGSDGFAEFESWREWRRIVAAANLAVMVRPGWKKAYSRLSADVRQLLDEGRAQLVTHEPLRISSSEIRRRLALGRRPPRNMLPPLVLDYAQKYDLYRSKSPADAFTVNNFPSPA